MTISRHETFCLKNRKTSLPGPVLDESAIFMGLFGPKMRRDTLYRALSRMPTNRVQISARILISLVRRCIISGVDFSGRTAFSPPVSSPRVFANFIFPLGRARRSNGQSYYYLSFLIHRFWSPVPPRTTPFQGTRAEGPAAYLRHRIPPSLIYCHGYLRHRISSMVMSIDLSIKCYTLLYI